MAEGVRSADGRRERKNYGRHYARDSHIVSRLRGGKEKPDGCAQK